MALRRIKGSGITDGTVGADDLASTLNLSSKTVTLPAASVTAHVTSYDDNHLKNDIALLGFKLATSNSLSQYSLNKQIINEFASSTDGIDASASTNEAYTSGYWYGGVAGFGGDDTNTIVLIHGDETVSGGNFSANGTNFGTGITASFNGSQSDFSTNRAKWGSKSMYFDGTGDNVTIPSAAHMNFVSSKPFTIDCWLYQENTDEERFIYGVNGSNALSINLNSATGAEPSGRFEQSWSWSASSRNHNTHLAGDGGFTTSNWHHYVFTWNGSGTSVAWLDGAIIQTNSTVTQGPEQLAWQIGYNWTGNIDEFRLSNVVRTADSGDPLYSSNGTTYTVPTEAYSDTTAGSDLTLQSTATTASSAPTKGDLILLYSDQAGTGALNTDLKGYISRDGTNFTEVTLTAEGTYGSQKVAVAHDVTLTSASGTSMKWKVTTHNQSAGSKEQRIHAVSLGWS